MNEFEAWSARNVDLNDVEERSIRIRLKLLEKMYIKGFGCHCAWNILIQGKDRSTTFQNSGIHRHFSELLNRIG